MHSQGMGILACRVVAHRVVGRVHEQVSHTLLIRACKQSKPPESLGSPSVTANVGAPVPLWVCKAPRATIVEATLQTHRFAGSRPDFWLCWRSSHEELRYGACSKLADREEPRVAVVRRGHQHHAVGAASTSAASLLAAADLDLTPALVDVVALRHVDEPPLPASDWQHDGSTYTNIKSVTLVRPSYAPSPSHAIVQRLTAMGLVKGLSVCASVQCGC